MKPYLAVVPIVTLTFVLSACTSGPVVQPEVEDTISVSPTPTEEAEPLGTRGNPVAVGVGAKHSDASVWTYTVGETDSDAWPEISSVNQFSSPPEAGSAYIMLPVHLVVEDAPQIVDGADPWASFEVSYVTAGGNSFDERSCTAVLPAPGSLYDVGLMFGGAEADFVSCVQVPAGDIAGGTWRIASLISTDAVYFVGAP
jgi:hypothetical protein